MNRLALQHLAHAVLVVVAAAALSRCGGAPSPRTGLGTITLTTSHMSALLDSIAVGVPENRSAAIETLRLGADARLGELVLSVLRSKDPARRHGIVHVFTTDSIPGTDSVASGLSDPSAYVRWASARIAGAQHLRHASGALIDLTADPDIGVRRATADALGQLGDTTAVPAITALIEDSAEEVRASAAIALGRFGAVHLPVLRHMAEQDSGMALASALEGIGAIPSRESVSILSVFALDGTIPVRIAACRALGMQRSDAADSLLQAIGADDPYPLVRETAAIALGEHDSALLTQLVESRMDREPDVFVRLGWVHALAPNSPRNRDLLRAFSETDPSADVRAAARAVLRGAQR